jgi:hypothetical protein
MIEIFTEEMLEQLTRAVYGKTIQMIDISKGKTYGYDVEPIYMNYYDDNLWNAVEIGYMSQKHYGLLLNDICIKGMLKPGKYVVNI